MMFFFINWGLVYIIILGLLVYFVDLEIVKLYMRLICVIIVYLLKLNGGKYLYIWYYI